MNKLKNKLTNLTQRLDHQMPDPQLTNSENAAAAAELRNLSAILFDLLPDKSLSPMERVERLARVVEREPDFSLLKSANEKITEIKEKIDNLIPGDGNTAEKLIALELLISDKSGSYGISESVINKLERIGDPRGKVEPE